MSNSMRTVIFMVSLVVFLLFFAVANFIIPPTVRLDSPYSFAVSPLLYIIGYIAALYTQAFMKQLYTANYMKGSNILKVFPVKAYGMRERLIILTLPFIAVLMPIVGSRKVTSGTFIALAAFVLLEIIIEILFYLNAKTIKAYITDRGIGIKGLDFRLELSIPFSYTNAVGWYPYERLENYTALGNKLTLYHSYDMGSIELECSEEELRQLIGLLVSKNIPKRRY
jgi:hypothetical protein